METGGSCRTNNHKTDDGQTDDIENLTKNYELLAEKYEKLTIQLEDRIKCPVCLDIPRSGPVFCCPKGHAVCSSCYQGHSSECPMCRTRMYRNTSLLAATVIESIEHVCKHEECGRRMTLEELEEHMADCAWRQVACPAVRCKRKVTFSTLMDHILNECNYSFAKRSKTCIIAKESLTRTIFSTTTAELRNSQFEVSCFTWNNNYFFLTMRNGEGGARNFYVQMFGSEEECSKLKVTISLTDESGKVSLSYGSQPYTMDLKEKDRIEAGFILRFADLEKFCSKAKDNEDRSQFTVALKFEELQ